jgi:uncharacterized lipoprotein YajG
VGCAPYAPKPHVMKTGMINDYQTQSIVNVVNTQTREDSRIERFGGVPVNLKETTNVTIQLLKEELAKRGVTFDSTSNKTLRLSVEELYHLYYIPGASVCQVTCLLEAGDGLAKKYQEVDASGLDIFHACNFAITKIVASIINDQEVRNIIDQK